MTVKELIEKLQALPEEYKSFDVVVHAHASLMDTYSVELIQERFVGQGGAEEVDRFIVIQAD